MAEVRSQWGSKLGFVLAASGSAIGLGNIVFFSANAYKFGSGAFYLPYLTALVIVGLPLMLLELSLGSHTGKAFPQSLYSIGKKPAEFIGWWGVLNATVISMYYVTILGWVLGMLIGSLTGLWSTEPVTAGAFGSLGLSNPFGFFFQMLGSWRPIIFVLFVWLLNFVLVYRGTRSIEAATRWIVPLMWIAMIALIVRGLTLPSGEQGVYLLFNPNFEAMKNPEVWKGAFSQMFFTLSLGFGIMTAYSSYLPKDSDQVHNTATISFLNCSFEFVAGLAVFSLLFAFAVVPRASTLSMMFFVVPQGIANLPSFVVGFGALFFFLLFIAGLSSSISLVEALVSALMDKFGWSRRWTLLGVVSACTAGSVAFALPHVVDAGLTSNGTLGLTLLDLIDHWAFSYGLLITGLVECILVGWVFGAKRLRAIINENSTLTIGWWWDALIKVVVPLILVVLLGWGIFGEITDGLYGHDFVVEGKDSLHFVGLLGWLAFTIGGGLSLTYGGQYPDEDGLGDEVVSKEVTA
jgi:neurotransmitter:Na+ symporter, NSS family